MRDDDEPDFDEEPSGPPERGALLRERHQAMLDRRRAGVLKPPPADADNPRLKARAKQAAPRAERPPLVRAAAPIVQPPAPAPLPASVAQAVEVALAQAPGLKVTVEAIDPAWATVLLTMSQGNRELRKQHVQWLAEQMRTGQWRLTHQGVAVSAGGRLLDGHHRLAAVKLSGATVPMLVLKGIPDEAWGVTDCGIVRTVGDRISLVEDRNLNRRIIEVIQSLRRLEVCHKGKLTPDQVTADWHVLRAGLEAVFGVLTRPITGITRSPVIGALARYYARNPDGALEFARALIPGSCGERCQPAYLLRRWLLAPLEVGVAAGRMNPDAVYWTTAGACRAHHNGVEIAELERISEWWD